MSWNKFIVLSDLHIGHPLNDFDLLLEGFNQSVVPELYNSQAVFITGDYFHTALNLNHIHSQHAFSFLSKLLHLSKQYNFKVRILQGTYSHDRDQLKRFIPLITGWDVDFKYIDTIYYEELSDLKFLYLPDYAVYQDLKNLTESVRQLSISNNHPVDFIMVHGLFDFYNYKGNLPCYNLEYLSSLCKYKILAGHIHTHRVFKKYISVGSFTRFRHGEEEDKGFIVVTKDNDIWNIEFKVNPCTIKFMEVLLPYDDPDQIFKEYQQFMQQHFHALDLAYVKVVLHNLDQLNALKTYTWESYPKIIFTYKPIKKMHFQTTFDLNTQIQQAQDLSTLESVTRNVKNYLQNNNVPITFNIESLLNKLDYEVRYGERSSSKNKFRNK
jgi:predicted phosphodiesterase